MSKVDFTLKTTTPDFRGAAAIGANGAQMIVSSLQGLAQTAKEYGDTVTEKNTQELLGVLNQAKTPEEVESAASNIMSLANQRFAGNVKLPVLTQAIDERPSTLMQRGIAEGQFKEFGLSQADKPRMAELNQAVIRGDWEAANAILPSIQGMVNQGAAAQTVLSQKNVKDNQAIELAKVEATAKAAEGKATTGGVSGLGGSSGNSNSSNSPLLFRANGSAGTPIITVDADGNLIKQTISNRVSGIQPTIAHLNDKGVQFSQDEVAYMGVLQPELNSLGIDFNPTTLSVFKELKSALPEANANTLKVLIDIVAKGDTITTTIGEAFNLSEPSPVASKTISGIFADAIAKTGVDIAGNSQSMSYKGISGDKFAEWKGATTIAVQTASSPKAQTFDEITTGRSKFDSMVRTGSGVNENISTAVQMFRKGLKGEPNWNALIPIIDEVTKQGSAFLETDLKSAPILKRLNQAYKVQLVKLEEGRLAQRQRAIENATVNLKTLFEQGGLDPKIVTPAMVEDILNGKEVITDGAKRLQQAANANIEPSKSRNVNAYNSIISSVAQKYNLDPALMKAVMHTESNFNPNARSPKNAQGLMQMIPATAKRFGVQNAYDPAQNIEGGAKYMRWLLDRYNGNIPKTLAAYNAGEGAVDKAGGIPPFPETQDYVKKVLGRYNTLYANNPLPADVRYENEAFPQESAESNTVNAANGQNSAGAEALTNAANERTATNAGLQGSAAENYSASMRAAQLRAAASRDRGIDEAQKRATEIMNSTDFKGLSSYEKNTQHLELNEAVVAAGGKPILPLDRIKSIRAMLTKADNAAATNQKAADQITQKALLPNSSKFMIR